MISSIQRDQSLQIANTKEFLVNFKSTFCGKKVLITGHTGFKGAWLTIWLTQLGAQVVGISQDIPTTPSLFSAINLSKQISDHRFNITSIDNLCTVMASEKPDYIIHMAAQSLVKRSYLDPFTTWQSNLLGTVSILEATRRTLRECNIVIVTSDKCYKNKEWVWGYRENDELGGGDPYSASKAAAELSVRSYINSFFNGDMGIRVASARAGNVIGGGDWAGDRIVPDCVRAWSDGTSVLLRNPSATRPWQHVLEPLGGYLYLAQKLSENQSFNGESYNFGPLPENDHSVLELVHEMSKNWNQVSYEIDGSSSEITHAEAGLLKLSCEKAMSDLGWHATLDFSKTVQMTTEWYKSFYENSADLFEYTVSQINDYTILANNQKLEWAK